MDADGSRSKGVARSLRKLGTKASITAANDLSSIFMPIAFITQAKNKTNLLIDLLH